MALEDEIKEACDQITQVNQGRAAFYRMISSLFYREVTMEKIAELTQVSWDGLGDEEGDELAEGLRMMTGAIVKADARTRQKLASDYAHTFLAAGNYEERMAVPYESVYTSEDGLLMQEARDDVYRMFCNEHLGVQEGKQEPEDHISFECEFMALLADRLNDALAQRDWHEAKRLASTAFVFHGNHLENWIDDLCDAVDRCAQTKFYLGLSKATRAFVHADADSVAEIAQSVNAMAAACE